MLEKQKAEELLELYVPYFADQWDKGYPYAKDCAILTCKELFKLDSVSNGEGSEGYWLGVINEIKELWKRN